MENMARRKSVGDTLLRSPDNKMEDSTKLDTVKVKFCTQCGQSIEIDEDFCGSCGKPVRRLPTQGVSPAVLQPVTPSGNSSAATEVPTTAPSLPLSPVALIARFILTLDLYWWFWLHRAYKQVRSKNPSTTDVTPGLEIGRAHV